MEKVEVEKSNGSEDPSQLSRNRSFKSKQLVRSQAIRETHSPPRTVSPSVAVEKDSDTSPPVGASEKDNSSSLGSEERSDANSNSDCNEIALKQRVEIQITQGAWDEPHKDQRQRTRRWLGHKQHSRDLLSNNPRVACVCSSTCASYVHTYAPCRERRRKHMCPTKQDSGIVCSDDCPDCSDTEPSGGSNADGDRKTNSLDGDGEFYCSCPDRKEKPKNLSISRTDSDEKTEPSGPELVAFIKETLNKSSKDRMTLLKIEKELHALVTDVGRCIVRFPVMTSYGRMLVHRCAALFQLAHNLDPMNKNAVLVSKSGTSGGRLPCTGFKQWCTTIFPPNSPQRMPPDATNAKSILKRDTHSLDEPGAGALNAARSKSLEQREREYERVRRRIFSEDNCTQDESQWQWLGTGPVKLLTSEAGRNKLLKVQSLEGPSSGPTSSGARGPVSKSHSFGGYARQPDPPRLLSRQGDLASSSWRLSPSSSGYRTLSLHSADSVTVSPTGGASPEPGGAGGAAGAGGAGGGPPAALVWAVTDMAAVPPGAVVIHPQTGRPLTNPDGSVYHFDPLTPPVLAATSYPHDQTKIENPDKKRGRLEKQQSFIDNECDCPPTDECRTKCCCDCRRQDPSIKNDTEKTITQQDRSSQQKPTSPSKTRYDPNATNQNAPQEPSTNHRPAYDTTTNQIQSQENQPNLAVVYDASNQLYNISANLRPEYEMARYEPNRQFENRPPSYEANQTFDLTNQRAVNELANQRVLQLTNQGSPEVQYIGQQYQQGYTHEQMSLAGATYLPQEIQYKQTIQDPNLRPISNPMPYGMVYNVQYPYQQVAVYDKKCDVHIDNTARVADPNMYQYAAVDYSQCSRCEAPGTQPGTQYSTIYTPMEPLVQYQPQYTYQDPSLQWQNVPSMPTVPSVPSMTPLVGVGTPAAQQKLYVREVYPVIYPYPQYNIMYPQQVPLVGGYGAGVGAGVGVGVVCPEPGRRAPTPHRGKRNSASSSSRNTPLTQQDDKKVPYEENTHNIQNPIHTAQTSAYHVQTHHNTHQNNYQNVHNTVQNQQNAFQNQLNANSQQKTFQNRQSTGQHTREFHRQDSNEIAAKIQQIKEQMQQLNTGEKNPRPPREEWRRRNSGNGILGSYPVNNFNGRVLGRPNNDNQLSSAARAIVNSIRHMQGKNNYQDRREYNHNNYSSQPRDSRPEPRARRPDPRPPAPYRPTYLLRQVSPGTWCRRSPGQVHPVLNHPRRPNPDNRNNRR